MGEKDRARDSIEQARERISVIAEELSYRASVPYVKAQAREAAEEKVAEIKLRAHEKALELKEAALEKVFVLKESAAERVHATKERALMRYERTKAAALADPGRTAAIGGAVLLGAAGAGVGSAMVVRQVRQARERKILEDAASASFGGDMYASDFMDRNFADQKKAFEKKLKASRKISKRALGDASEYLSEKAEIAQDLASKKADIAAKLGREKAKELSKILAKQSKKIDRYIHPKTSLLDEPVIIGALAAGAIAAVASITYYVIKKKKHPIQALKRLVRRELPETSESFGQENFSLTERTNPDFKKPYPAI